ncbi:MAG: VOC family protein [Gammaproteobacteria bacterium]|nr:VOC family protein [Gammaproteobacteria bacterium]
MSIHEKINYVEFPCRELSATKTFFESVFSWQFTDYGTEYTAFANSGLDGGFYRSELHSSAANGGALVVFYSDDLESTLQKVKENGGEINEEIFSFPGGRRFHFVEPGGNEFAVWSDK